MILMIDIGIYTYIRIAFGFQDFNDFNVSENIFKKKREQT